MRIGHIQKTSLIDYPGKICSIIFTQGCNFACPYCHNPELVDPERFVEPLAEEEIFSFLKKRSKQIDAVVITGGEPTIHSDLVDFMVTIKGLGYLIKLDTNGSNPGAIENIIEKGIVDYIAMDIKSIPDKYSETVRVPIDTDKILSSIHTIMGSHVPYEFRTTVSRSLISQHDIIQIGHMIKGAQLYVLQNFVSSKHVDKTFINEKGFTTEELSCLKKELDALVAHCVVR